MTLSDLSSIVGVISGVAVLVSLVYLGQQTRQNSKHTRALIQQGRTDRMAQIQLAMADTALSSAWLTANGQVVTSQSIVQRQFYLQCITYRYAMEDTEAQYADGLLSEGQFQRFRRGMVSLINSNPAWREFLIQTQ